ncbi:hypothetical protein ACFQFC_14695 [Amorphoplanes digitatis]|uniref:Clumping factor A n=1 Tax=Actinoplanes digitatis TaxID=1868 RepID=A0A7W7MSL2_9ACTN|nr:hypothetical protein [Actinoplanes digitatis]GID93651.1 hypothetical protein Adi01nite_30630 [Actinoplanes digitatis]
MIVASLLLILVAVTLLVLGLAGGSSSLLISSIVASLLAAVALVIGARQASAARRAVRVPGDDPVGEPARAHQDAARGGDHPAGDPFPEFDGPQDDEAAYAAGRRDADEYHSAPDVTQRVHPDADLYDDAAAGRTSSGQAAGAASRAEDPDYDRAATVIGGARAAAPDEDAWRGEPAPADAAPAFAEAPAAHDLSFAGPESSGPDYAGPADEFDEPDPDDPDDEPLPQAVRPADAVKVARLDAEVLVVDGRPRYHLPDCPHLIGRMTEGLPVAEAVELGFSPCGLCRPVDRLVAAAARY